jgi:hypothetical protein
VSTVCLTCAIAIDLPAFPTLCSPPHRRPHAPSSVLQQSHSSTDAATLHSTTCPRPEQSVLRRTLPTPTIPCTPNPRPFCRRTLPTPTKPYSLNPKPFCLRTLPTPTKSYTLTPKPFCRRSYQLHYQLQLNPVPQNPDPFVEERYQLQLNSIA